MTETQRRIRAYQKVLPELRERVVAVALLLAMSASMLTSASFAWLTISRRPEVSGVSTTVAANGNLEIALATSTTPPGESQIGDSSATKGQSITAANVTWGNLVNLSDENYGLQNLILRPAQLNENALLTSPLYGAVYTQDGRVEKLNSNFSYTSWIPPEGNNEGRFGLTQDLGVRAVSSTKREVVGFYGNFLDQKALAETSNVTAANIFKGITQDDDWMKLLANLMGIHMTANLNGEDKYKNHEVSAEELDGLITMYAEFIRAFEAEAEAMANLLNVQQFAAYGGNTSAYSTYNGDAILALSPNSGRDYIIDTGIDDGKGATKKLKITDLKTFLDDYKMLVADKKTMETINASGDRRWTASGLRTIVNKLVNIDKCYIQFKGEDPKMVGTFVSNMASNPVAALGYRGKACTAIITNGVLYNMDLRVGARIQVPATTSSLTNLPITAKMYVNTMNLGEQTATVYATIYTSFFSSTEASLYANDLAYVDSLYTGTDTDAGDVVAEDTYALVVDLWVKTNSEGSYLTLEGNVLTQEDEVVAMGKDSSGNSVELYTLTRIVQVEAEDGTTTNVTENYDLYQNVTSNEDGTSTTTWYDASTFSEFPLQDKETPVKKMETLITVIGYEGENRIWDNHADLLSTDATTQGSGSCYVYYADTPEDQARSLELLKSMNVAFIDADGNLLATARMDTESSYEESGRVIVPLVLTNDSLVVGEDENAIRAIMPLAQNKATRITALVYLDGTQLSNEHVLSAADIQGQLNIQFGSSAILDPIENEALSSQIRTASATVSVSEFDYDTHEGDMTTRVTINVDGEEPKTVTAFFLRQINSSQGSREKVMTFTKDEASGAWVSDYTFTAPGNYILRTAILDGMEYVLKTQPTVKINGFTVESLSCTQANSSGQINIMTAENSYKVDLTLRFASSDVAKMPASVQGRFLRDDGTAVNVNFTYNSSGNWTGSATFLASGDYTFQYLVLDGEYAELPSTMWQTATVYLGMRVAVYTDGNTSFKYLPSEMADNEKILPMYVKIMDNTDEAMIGLTGAQLTYKPSAGMGEMNTNIVWDAASGYYYGELRTLESGGPGVWKFNNVTVGGNNITNATTSPTFTMIAPEPPSFNGLPNTTNYQFAPNGGAFMEANINYSATATVQAVIADSDGKEYEVQGTLNSNDQTTNVGNWRFIIPNGTKVTGKQDGYWTMKEIRVWNYYDAEGNYIAAEVDDDGKLVADGQRDEPMVFNVSDADYTKKVVQTVTVAFARDQGKTFGVDGNGNVTSQFLTEHTISGVTVDIKDFEGAKLEKVTGMSLVYNYDGATQANGGYTSTSVSAKEEILAMSFAEGDNGVTFTQATDQKIQQAGNYTPASFSFAVNGVPYSYTAGTDNWPNNVPSFAVKSKAPTVTISSVSSNASSDRYYLSSTPSSLNVITGSYNKKIDDYNAVVYMYVIAQSGTLDQEQVAIKYPTVTLALTGVPTTHTGVTMVFPSGNNTNSTFTFAAGGTTAKTTIGAGTDGVFNEGFIGIGSGVTTWPKFYPAGKQTVDEVTIVHNGLTYTVDLSHGVTINNPQYPPYVTYTISDSTFTGTIPPRQYSEDGETITVTLPTISSWTQDMSSTTNGEFVVQSGYPSTRNVYTQRTESSGCSSTTYYTPYIETTTVSKATSATTTWVRTKTITGWKIGSTTYKPGDTVTLTGNQTITAVIGSSDGTKTTNSSITTRTVIEYTASGAETTARPSGTKVENVTGSTTDEVS